MTDTDRGMEGSAHRNLKAARIAVAGALLAGALAVAGCGGGGSKNAAAPVAPVTPTGPSSSGPVAATGTKGLVGPAERASKGGSQSEDKGTQIAANANHVPKSHGHAVGGTADCGGDITPDGTNTSAVNQAILCLLNAIRADPTNGSLPPLSENAQLDQAAQGMGDLMVKEQFFSHTTPEGKGVVDRIQPTGYIPNSGDWVVGENLAWGNGALSTPNAIVNGWMNSPPHKANILAPDYKDIGLAAVQGAPSPQVSGGTTYVNDFGAKSGANSNVTLPPENGSGGNTTNATSASTGGGNTNANASSKKSSHHKAKKKRRKRKRH
jgi:uncharacterized protein YkwD